jgi:toluene monooxygenase system protein D
MTDTVGPVLDATEIGRAIVAAIQATNANVTVQDRGAYLRVLVPGRCAVSREAIERALGRPFRLPGELEQLMPSFKGTITMTTDEVVWAWRP